MLANGTPDPDTLALTADPEETTLIACYLNGAMERDSEARARYLAIWGVEWSPLGIGISIFDGASTTSATKR